MNRLYYGDCMTIMQAWPLNYVDLIYLDPPFNSQRQYSSIYTDETGRPLPDQIEAFCDMWELDAEREQAIRMMPVLMRESGIDDSVAQFWKLWMQALRDTQPRLLAYLSYMAERLLIMHRILKPTGSLYLHCDPTASHYIKALMDAIFGHRNFRSEIIWKRSHSQNSANRYGPVHDTILFYAKSGSPKWSDVRQPYDPDYQRRYFKFDDDDGRGPYWTGDITGSGIRHGATGNDWRGFNPTTKNRHWMVPPVELDRLDADNRVYWPPTPGAWPKIKRYLSEAKGVPLQDVITDIYGLSTMGAPKGERMGYATQKPVALLERLVSASTDPGDVVLDPFCGCATTLEAAHTLGRQWIGIDIAIHAIKRVARIRLNERCGLVEGQDYTVEGVPRNLEGARDLWRRDKYHFQRWAVEQVDGFVTTRQTADGGIDGRLYFAVPDATELQSMVLEVKGGANVTIRDVRALAAVLEADDALMAGLIIMEPRGATQTRNFERFMANAGTLDVLGVAYPRLQMLTVGEILDGQRFNTPTVAAGRHEAQPVLPGTPAPG